MRREPGLKLRTSRSGRFAWYSAWSRERWIAHAGSAGIPGKSQIACHARSGSWWPDRFTIVEPVHPGSAAQTRGRSNAGRMISCRFGLNRLIRAEGPMTENRRVPFRRFPIEHKSMLESNVLVKSLRRNQAQLSAAALPAYNAGAARACFAVLETQTPGGTPWIRMSHRSPLVEGIF